MAGFLYFISGEQRPPSREQLNTWQLGYAFTRSPEHRQVIHSGPGGKPGSVIADPDRHAAKKIGYFPAEQTWRKLPAVDGRPEIWLGYWNDAKPTPEDLARKSQLHGRVAMTLGDGHSWIIPTLTEFDPETKSGECALPAPLDYDDDGNLFTTQPTGELGRLWDAVYPVALRMCFPGDGIDEPTGAEIRNAAFVLLTANYAVSMPELAILGCLEREATFRSVVLASCRGQWVLDAVHAK